LTSVVTKIYAKKNTTFGIKNSFKKAVSLGLFIVTLPSEAEQMLEF
jgi:hypothetical protein